MTANEALCLEYSNRTGEPRYVNLRKMGPAGEQVEYQLIETYKGANCLAFAKDGALYRIGARGPTICDERVEAVQPSN